MVRTQARLGINPTQFNILVILLSYWFDPAKPPFPSKERIAKQIGCSASTVRRNTKELETAGLLKRRQNRTKAGDWGSNSYDLKGLVTKLKSFEPEFAKARELRKAAEAAERKASTPKGRRKAAST